MHSGHMSKIFRALNGTSGKLHWREVGELERVWCIDPAHPIAAGVPEHFDIPVITSYSIHYTKLYEQPNSAKLSGLYFSIQYFVKSFKTRACPTSNI